MPSHKPTEQPVRADAPLTWEDVQEVSGRLGVRPASHKTKRRSEAATRIHSAYRSWLDRQGLVGFGYVMSLGTIYQDLANRRTDGSIIECRSEKHAASREAKRIIVAALNDNRSGIELLDRPLHRYRKRVA